MSIKTVEYTLPNYWASALIDGDYSGDNDAEIAVINEWLADHPYHSCIDVADDASFMRYHDASSYGVLACNVATFTFQVLR
jgi:hypothetical protein